MHSHFPPFDNAYSYDVDISGDHHNFDNWRSGSHYGFDTATSHNECYFIFQYADSFRRNGIHICVDLKPKAKSYSSDLIPGSSNDVIYYSLPTTVYASGGITQTFSEDQITTMSDFTGTTTSTTTWTETDSSSTSTTVVPIIIAPGGFYWSPIPLPTGPKFRIPNLPSPPPIPSPPCFKFLDIFSIDCPPNHNNPTTHFISGPPKPTCTANCGARDTSDDDKDEKSTSTCATETNSVCRTTSGIKTCNTYVGCDCVTSTVTDYWVSCSASDDCSTTSSDVITGCFVTATKTTTGEYCPMPTYDAALEDVGDGWLNGVAPSYTTTALPESLIIGGSVYTATSGTVVIGGSTISLISVTVTTVITVDGKTGTLYPPTTRNVIDPAILESMGFTSYDPDTTSLTITIEKPIPTGGTLPAASTTTTQTSTQAAGTPPAEPTARLVIAYEWSGNTLDFSPGSWSFYTPALDETYDVCLDSIGTADAGDYDLSKIPFPDGTIDFDFKVLGTSGCSYTGSSDSPGSLSCPDLTHAIQCQETTYDELQCFEGDPVYEVVVYVKLTCSW
ncbi:hypothetical protein TruAng_008139 [Truncatella angustata]|nr:hypothetical protein TruAng_008139 [Truncatella angustata]